MKKYFFKKLYIALIIAVVITALSACSSSDSKLIPAGAVRIYCSDINMTSLTWEYYVPEAENEMDCVSEILDRLDKDPENSLYVRIKPSAVTIKSFYIGEDGQLVIDFNENYLKMDRITEILCRAGIVKTMCEIDGIDSVEFYVEGQPLMLKSDSSAGIMKSTDFIDNTGEEVLFRQTLEVTVYFSDLSGTMLNESRLIIESGGKRTQEELAIEQLINGPLYNQTDMLPVIPDGTKLNKIVVKDGIAYVDFNENFLEHIDGISEEVEIYSVVNTLAEFTTVSKVSFTINGNTVKNYGDIPFNVFFERRPDLITTEKAGDATE